MKRIITLALVLLAISAVPANAADYRGNYSKRSYTGWVISNRGQIIGTVAVQKKGNLVYTDYDFDEPSDCKLQSITTNKNGNSKTYKVTSKSGNTLKDFPNTYIAPRDAVLAYSTNGQHYPQSHQFKATLKLLCKNGYITAHTQMAYPTPVR